MPLTIPGLEVSIYTLPADGAGAHARFLELLHSPGETWVAAYACTDGDLLAEIERADLAGVAVHLLLDHSQAQGATERPLLAALAGRLRHGDITITTAGPTSPSPFQIMHSKVLITAAPDGPDWSSTGSVNFSTSGWLQGNVATVFRCNAWSRGVFLPWFEATRDWARSHVPQLPAATAALPSPPGLSAGCNTAGRWPPARPS